MTVIFLRLVILTPLTFLPPVVNTSVSRVFHSDRLQFEVLSSPCLGVKTRGLRSDLNMYQKVGGKVNYTHCTKIHNL